MHRQDPDPSLAAGPGEEIRDERGRAPAVVSASSGRGLANAWSFYRGHREEIERQIQENEAA